MTNRPHLAVVLTLSLLATRPAMLPAAAQVIIR